MSDPLVSVIIPTYNRARLLPRAIASIVAQTFCDWELILIDDGSTDGTGLIAAEWASRLGDRLVYVRRARAGACAARNAGIELARGRYVAFLDSDDEFVAAKLERQLRLFALRPELGLVYCDYSTVDIQGRRESSVFDGRHATARAVTALRIEPGLYVCRDLFDTLLRGYFISTIAGLVRRDVLGRTIRFREELRFGEEWLFYLEVARASRAGFVDEPLAVYHFQAGSLSRSDKDQNAAEFRRLLLAMLASFPELRAEQLRVIRRHLGQLNRQLGCAAYRQAHYAEAGARFAEAVRFEPDVRTAWHLGQSLWQLHVGWPRGTGSARRSGQDTTSVVR